MIGLEDRRSLAQDIDAARQAGARQARACAVAGLDRRTFQRWRVGDGLVIGDGRPKARRSSPSHALTPAERAKVLRVANEARFAAMPPARIVPQLADEGIYLASESSFARILREQGQNAHRGRAKPPRASRPPTTHTATGPGQVWCWDMTFLPTHVQGRWFYLYLILDLYSRKIVGFTVHDTDSADHAAHLARRTALTEGVHGTDAKPVLHGDNGATMKATTVLAMLHWLGIATSWSRPRVSDDNAFVEALFRTAKYRPEFPVKGFADLDAAQRWANGFVCWYNHAHRHSAIRFVTPAERHEGRDQAILAGRHDLYQRARASNPARWSRHTRNWTAIGPVTLNPEGDPAGRVFPLQSQLACSIGEPAFPPRPGFGQAAARSAGDGRSGATRSHAQSAEVLEHGEDGEHRTFPEASTVAPSRPVGETSSAYGQTPGSAR
jgi:transposase InsO family protein